MKKLLFTLSAFFIFQAAKAQNSSETLRPLTNDQNSLDFLQYRDRWNLKISAGLGATYRNEANFLKTSALSISAEPSYRLTNYIAVGLRGEYTFMRPYVSEVGRVKADPIGSLSATADIIKLWNHKYAPFIGIGAGFYRLGYGQFPAGQLPTSEQQPVVRKNLGTRFGVSPRIGINLQSFSISIEMNLIDEKVFYNRDYMTLKIGYTL
ncbi:hypothetical protein [Dyadobacter frigoris]|uniref:Porin family protein n=1 Tax=Dyadobacter frigoris TaxID=2576211 RepID=A0A4U6D0M4_9BACT|nr:hypothetical protein [Dyadobacter frigoris]TKT90642.1 hypothetical protein FDK13_20190 [Dyadobacter frigoris]GLU51206.1 hypothetical protein Dfri01_06670 [Dyadobacter frigoris]